ncbi:MAG: hypothetical protein HY042_04700 [Spirochaetia bacterium]|nr:hypothetical protein [Spirochaetia bacterium]
MKYFAATMLALVFAASFGTACKKGEVIEEIGAYTITTRDYEDYYGAYLEKASRLVNAEKKTLYQLVCNPPDSRANPILADLVSGLNPTQNYKKYRDMRIIEQVAKQTGFMDRPVVRQILDQVVLETVAQLYIQEKMDERTKISTEQKQKKCEDLRRELPDKVGPLPLDRCMELAEGILKREQIERQYPEIVQEIKESVTIHRNANFNKDDFLEKKIELYNTMRKEGGCGPMDAKSAIESVKESDKKETKKEEKKK